MNETEAKTILGEHLGRYKKWSYPELVQLLDRHQTFKITGPSGAAYTFELQVKWETVPDGPLLVAGSVNDAATPPSAPLSDSFVVGPSESAGAP